MPQSDSPNPQGKGLVPVLAALDDYRPVLDQRRSAQAHLEAYVFSRLILCAEFGFRPIQGQDYSLYIGDAGLKLSLIAPSELGAQHSFGLYVASCRLEADMTWRVSDFQLEQAREPLQKLMRDLSSGLMSDLTQAESLGETLPEYDIRLPFHRRVLANGLSKTMKAAFADELAVPLPQLMAHYEVQMLTKLPS